MDSVGPRPMTAIQLARTTERLQDADIVIADRRIESASVVSFGLELPSGGALPDFSPGSHIDLILPDGVIRQYSLIRADKGGRRWWIGVLREPAGRGGSAWLHDHGMIGSVLRARGPRNNFPLLPAQRYLFIAGGIGITPLLPMISSVSRGQADWTLWYGGRARASMAFLDELTRYPARVVVHPEDEFGMLDLAVILGRPVEQTLIYCCGPAGLIDAVEQHCKSWPARSLQVERFSAKVREPLERPDGEIEVVCSRSQVTVVVSPEETILQALENGGVDVLSSCTYGVCGSCITPVLEGIPDHRDSVLTDEERAAGNVMTVCVSRARGRRLVLDL